MLLRRWPNSWHFRRCMMLRRTAWHKFFWVVLVVCVFCAVFAQLQVSAPSHAAQVAAETGAPLPVVENIQTAVTNAFKIVASFFAFWALVSGVLVFMCEIAFYKRKRLLRDFADDELHVWPIWRGVGVVVQSELLRSSYPGLNPQ